MSVKIPFQLSGCVISAPCICNLIHKQMTTFTVTSVSLLRCQAKSGGCARPFVMDVTDEPAVRIVMGGIESALGPIHVLVNNAGQVGRIGPFCRERSGGVVAPVGYEPARHDALHASSVLTPFTCFSGAT